MADMTDFFVAMLNAIAAWLSSEPIVYLYGLFLLLVIVAIFKRLVQ